MLDIRKLKAGSGDLKGLLAALMLIFVCAPALAFLVGKAPLSRDIVIGFFILSAAPTTLSSGVVMTTVSGGNMAHALLVSLLSSALSVATVPLTLPLLLAGLSQNTPVVIDQRAMVFKIGVLVLCPLLTGLVLRKVFRILVALCLTRFLRLPPPVQKSVVFMDGQKTLPLTLMVQVSAFPAFPLALVVCVLHHLTQLFMDGYLVGRLGLRKDEHPTKH